MSGPTTTTQSSGTSKTNTSSNTTGSTTTNPYEPSQELINQYLGRLGEYQPPTSLSQSENDAYAGLRNVSQYGIPQLEQFAQGLLGGYGFGEGREGINQAYGTMQGALNPYAQGDYLDPNSNPYMQQIISQITNQARNNTGDAFARAGRSFSGAHAGAVARATTEGLAPTLFNQFNQQQGNQMNAANALMQGGLSRSQGLDASRSGALGAAGMAPNIFGQIGSQMASPYQTTLQQEFAQRARPYEGLQNLSQLLLPIASQFGTRDFESQMREKSKTSQTGMSSSETETDPWMTGISAAIGAAGLLSDRRAKQDVTRVGRLDNGLSVYSYRYLGENTTRIGLMADEVETVIPEAVSVGRDGLKRVDYMRATQ